MVQALIRSDFHTTLDFPNSIVQMPSNKLVATDAIALLTHQRISCDNI